MGKLFPHEPESAGMSASDHLWRAQPHLELCRRVLDRDEHRCCNCHITLPGWMEIHHRDNDHDHFSPDNLAAICHFCHLLYHPLQAGQFDYEPPLVLLRWPEIGQTILQNLAWLLLYLDHGDAVAEEDDEETQRILLHGVTYPAMVTHLKGIRQEITIRKNMVGEWGGVTLASLLEFAVKKGEPGSWSELRWFPAGLISPKRQLGLLSIATPTLKRIPFLNREDPPDGIYGNSLLHILHSGLAGQPLLDKGQKRLERHRSGEGDQGCFD